jgi:hypothetical protein
MIEKYRPTMAVDVLRAWAEDAQSELDALRKDAERYRYLRNRVPSEVLGQVKSAAGCWIDCEDDEGVLVLLTGDDADAAIDAARGAE